MATTPNLVARKRSRPAGRPRFFEPQALMEIWLAVEGYRARHQSSVNMACKKLELTFLITGTKAADREQHAFRAQVS